MNVAEVNDVLASTLQIVIGISGDVLELSQATLKLFSSPVSLYPEYMKVRVPDEVTSAPE